MNKIDKHFMRIALDAMPPKPMSDEEVWRTSEEGKHFKIETETGEIKAGFGGKFNGQKVDPSKKGSSKSSSASAPKASASPKTATPKPAAPSMTPEQIQSRFVRMSEAFGYPKGDLKKYTPEQQKKFFENWIKTSEKEIQRNNDKIGKLKEMLANPELRGRFTEEGIKRKIKDVEQTAYLLRHQLEHQKDMFEREYPSDKPTQHEAKASAAISNKRETAKKFNDLLDKSVEERREGLADATKALADMPEGSVITTLLERGTRRDYTKKADGTWDASIQDYNAEPQNMSDDRMAKNILGAGKWGGTPALEVVVRKNGQNTSTGFSDRQKEAQTLQDLLPKVNGKFRQKNEAAIQAGDILERAPIGTYLEMERSDGRRRYVYKKLGEGDWGNANTVARTHYGSDEVVNELHEGSYSGDWTCRFVDKPQNWNYTK